MQFQARASQLASPSNAEGILETAERFSQRIPANLARAFQVVFDELLSPIEARIDGTNVVLFGTNSYLGLNFHPSCKAAATSAVNQFGTGSTASRVAGGTSRLHAQLEQDLASFYARRHAFAFSTGFMANLGVISALASVGDAVFLDSHCHASIIDAAKLSGAEVRFFDHNDCASLQAQFRQSRIPGCRTVVVVEGLYSVNGDLAALPALLRVAKDNEAFTVVDEAHALGVYGRTGRGAAEQLGVDHLADLIVGTFSKSLGVVGGFAVTQHDELRDLPLRARSYLYTASLPLGVVAAARESLRVMQSEPHLKERLWENCEFFRSELESCDIHLSGKGPIGRISIPIRKREDILAAAGIWQSILERGVYVNLMVPPATADGMAALRISVSAAHSRDHLIHAVGVISSVLKG